MERVLAESEHYIVGHSWEMVFLEFKTPILRTTGKLFKRTITINEVYIGYFYGDPAAAAIASDESFCVIVGCGMLIYYLKEPFKEYNLDKSTEQWKELFREKGTEWWIDDVEVTRNSTILFTVEKENLLNGGKYELDVATMNIRKCS